MIEMTTYFANFEHGMVLFALGIECRCTNLARLINEIATEQFAWTTSVLVVTYGAFVAHTRFDGPPNMSRVREVVQERRSQRTCSCKD